ncbi:hypothetical protein [Streptomyces sp. NPDC001492]
MTDQATQLPAHWSPALTDAFWTAVNAPTYEESAAATLAFAQLLTAVPVSSPPPDQTADRDRIAGALASVDGWRWAPGFKDGSPTWRAYQDRAAAVLAVLPPADRAAVLAEVLPAWEAVYEPGNVSDYLIGYANDQDAATGMAEAWMRSQAEVTGRLEWVSEERMATDRYDRWFELIERHGDGIDTGPGIVVRRRLAAEAQQEDDAGRRVYAWAQTIDTADGGNTVYIPGVHHSGGGSEETAVIVSREDVPVLAAMLAEAQQPDTEAQPEWARPETEEEKLAKAQRMAKALSAPPVTPPEWASTTEWPNRHKRRGDRRVHATAPFETGVTRQFWTACEKPIGKGGYAINHMPVDCRDCKRAITAVPVQPAADGSGEEARPTETVHRCPPDGSGLTPCCGRTPFELPISDRISSEAPVTCKGPRS